MKGIAECMMGKIFYVMGKSASGKDTIYKQLHSRMPELKTCLLYTSFPELGGRCKVQDPAVVRLPVIPFVLRKVTVRTRGLVI